MLVDATCYVYTIGIIQNRCPPSNWTKTTRISNLTTWKFLKRSPSLASLASSDVCGSVRASSLKTTSSTGPLMLYMPFGFPAPRRTTTGYLTDLVDSCLVLSYACQMWKEIAALCKKHDASFWCGKMATLTSRLQIRNCHDSTGNSIVCECVEERADVPEWITSDL